MSVFKKSVAAGAVIGVGATIYLLCENKTVGAFLFSLGLLMVCTFGMNLFTGKIGYILENKNNPNCLVIWLGNFVGSAAVSLLVRFARPETHEIAMGLAEKKMALSIPALACLSLMCGVLMYLAVENYARNRENFSGPLGIMLCVSVFILSGFEHSIADINYLIFAISQWQSAFKYIFFILIVSVFNAVGAIAMRQLTK